MKKGFMKMEKSSGLPVEVHASSVYARLITLKSEQSYCQLRFKQG